MPTSKKSFLHPVENSFFTAHLRLWYNAIMAYATVVIDAFWEIMTQFATIAAPIIGILLLFTIIRGLIFNGR